MILTHTNCYINGIMFLVAYLTALHFAYFAIHISHNSKPISYIELFDMECDLLIATLFYNIDINPQSKSPFQSKQWDKTAGLQFAYLHR